MLTTGDWEGAFFGSLRVQRAHVRANPPSSRHCMLSSRGCTHTMKDGCDAIDADPRRMQFRPPSIGQIGWTFGCPEPMATRVHRAARRTLQIRPIMRQQQKVIDDVDARHAHSTGSNLLDSVVQIRELTGTTDESNDRAIMEALRGAGWRVEGALETLFAQQDVRSAEANLGDRRTRQQQQLLFSSVRSQSLLLCKEKRGQGMKLNMGRHQWAQILKHKCPLTPSHMLVSPTVQISRLNSWVILKRAK